MSITLMEKGRYVATSCTSECDACGQVRPATQHTGRNGYAVICNLCNVELLLDMARCAQRDEPPAALNA